jgi:hypothetical protein
MTISSTQAKRFIRYRSKTAKALARSAFDCAALETLEYDEHELDDIRLHARDARDIDAMSDDSIAFHSFIRNHHVYRNSRVRT